MGKASADAGFRLCGGEAVDGARLAAFRSPPPPLRAHTYKLVSDETLAGRGGSVSRRDHNQAAGNRPTLQAEPIMQKSPTQTPAALRERGVWGERRFSQRSGLSPQNSPVPLYHFDAEFFADLGAVAAANAFRLVADALAVFDVKGSLAAAGYALTAATAVIVNHQAAGLAPRPR